uniref:Predicted protein n=1 Tax=Hordeum vulgare subsp. vulgare TaxID=112509 RepID=F2E773_HORVV|nr:predicted protein [Hordeum vulgare subsp. vulgare]
MPHRTIPSTQEGKWCATTCGPSTMMAPAPPIYTPTSQVSFTQMPSAFSEDDDDFDMYNANKAYEETNERLINGLHLLNWYNTHS